MSIDLDKLEKLMPTAQRALMGAATLADTAIDQWRTKKEIQRACKSDREAACAFYEALPELIRLARIGEKVQWRPVGEPDNKERTLLRWDERGGLPAHIDLGYRVEDGWCNTDGVLFSENPDLIIPLSALPEPPK
jgi:hypothetical protein